MKMKLDNNRNKAGLFEVSQSKVRQYRTCPRQWWYAHVMRLQRKLQARPLAFGSIVHKMKETLASGDNPYKVIDELPRQDVEAYEDNVEHYGEILTDIQYIFRGYQQYWKGNELIYVLHNKRRAEHPFEIEIPKEKILVKGTIDAVTYHRKYNWLTEHKNHKTIPNDDERWRSVQSVVYLRINQMLGWWKSIEGTCWDYMRTKSPTRPEFLKSGDLSTRKIDTLPGVVIDTIKAHVGTKKRVNDVPGAIQLIDAATANMANYYQRVYTPIKKQLVDQVWDDFIATARVMRDAPLKPPVRNIGRHCSWCQFEPICRASLSGGDEDFVIKYNYVPSTYGAKDEEAD